MLKPSSVYMSEIHLQRYHNGLSNPKGNKNLICTMVMFGKTFYRCHMPLDTRAQLFKANDVVN